MLPRSRAGPSRPAAPRDRGAAGERRMRDVGDDDVRHGPLESVHRDLGAKLGPFGGWLMPIEYAGVLSEHRSVRELVGLFDLSHLGKLDVVGPEAFEALQRLLTNDLGRVEVGRAQYHHLLNDAG